MPLGSVVPEKYQGKVPLDLEGAGMDLLLREKTDRCVLGDCSPEVTTGHLHRLSDEAGGSILEPSFRKGTGCWN